MVENLKERLELANKIINGLKKRGWKKGESPEPLYNDNGILHPVVLAMPEEWIPFITSKANNSKNFLDLSKPLYKKEGSGFLERHYTFLEDIKNWYDNAKTTDGRLNKEELTALSEILAKHKIKGKKNDN